MIDVHNNLVEEMENLLLLDMESEDKEKVERELRRANAIAGLGKAIAANIIATTKAQKCRKTIGLDKSEVLSLGEGEKEEE